RGYRVRGTESVGRGTGRTGGRHEEHRRDAFHAGNSPLPRMLVRQHFPRVAPCTGAGMVTPMPVTRRLWAPITFVTIALAACKGTEPFVPVPTSLHVDPSTLSFNSIGATRQVVRSEEHTSELQSRRE